MDPLKGPLELFRVGNIVDAVQATHTGVDGAVQVQPLHGLAQEDGLNGGGTPVFLRRLGQHLRRLVHSDHLIAPQGQLPGEGARAAGQVQHRPAWQGLAAEVLFDIVGPGGIADIIGQLVIAAGQKAVAVHHRRSFRRGMTR